MKTYNVCFIIKFLFCLLAFTSIHFFNFSHVYAQTLNSNNQFSLICKTIVTANVGNKGQIYETLYNFNLSPPTVYLNDLNVSYPVKYSENYIEGAPPTAGHFLCYFCSPEKALYKRPKF